MTTKNRSKNSEKSAASSQDDAPKKSQKSSGATNGVSGPEGPQGPRSGSCLGLIVTTVFYIAMIGAAGFAAFYLQQVVEEVRQIHAKHEESARRSGEMGTKMESFVQQVESLRSNVDGLESSLGITRVELEAAVSRMKRGELETRRVEEALQKLQNDLIRDLSEGIREVKEAREKDFSSLETTVEERLAEVSQSISASMAEFAEGQGEAQRQLADLKARLSDTADPTLVKQELSAIVEVVAEIKTAKEAADDTTNSLRMQISSVREELQTRNKEVTSLSQELESVRSVVQETAGSLRESLSAAETGVQGLGEQTVNLQSSLEQVTDAVRAVEERANAAAAQALRRADDLETRVKLSEENSDTLSASLSDLSSKVEGLLAKYDGHESRLSAQGEAVERVKNDLKQELKDLESRMEKLLSNIGLSGEETKLASEGSTPLQVELESLRTAVEEVRSEVATLESHDLAIRTLEKALQETKQEVDGLTGAKQDEGQSSLEELQNKLAAFVEAQNQLTAKNTGLDEQLEELEKRLTVLEDRI
ncbi:cytoskeleton-associated protein 4 [Cyprinodon tularosa]|uniref:cytoskeleton-associated protein 4 n=1 Tax=Cyprinodon tularosa TaxID=77115 RepID=UPI0018E23C1D|nr:cytoskeleton-associated protein 4 [Cyprinodon tularosa]